MGTYIKTISSIIKELLVDLHFYAKKIFLTLKYKND